MNVVVPYTVLAPETRASVPADARRVRTGRPGDYHRLLVRLWGARRTFILVEHDVVPRPGLLEEMWDCPRDWCAAPYRCGTIVTTALGCTKFSGQLQARNADAVTRMKQREWFNLDGQLVGTLHQHGEAEHVHGPPVRHLKYDREPFPVDQPQIRRVTLATKLLYVGDYTKYLHAIPAADFETDDPETIAICLESGLYIQAPAPAAAKKGAPAEAPVPMNAGAEPETTPAEDAAPAAPAE